MTARAKLVIRNGIPRDQAARYLLPADLARYDELLETALSTLAVTEALGCTKYELNRWDKDGRLRHAFKQAFYFYSGKPPVLGRMWFLDEVTAARGEVAAWREQDLLQKQEKQWDRALQKAKARGVLPAEYFWFPRRGP